MAIKKVLALAGGVGGAKLADGLAQVLPEGDLSVVVNIGDDFRHYGLHISPDLDTVMYTLSDYANPETGWGVRDESWQTLGMLQTYGEQTWFRLGDRDFATHILRRYWLDEGLTLTEITHRLSTALGVRQTILPASDDLCSTMVDTEELGTLTFQEYFVQHRWQPTVRRIWYEGIVSAEPTPQVLEAFDNADAILICPSNPILSIDPILALGDLRDRLKNRRVPCVAVSPLIHGKAVKGPADKMMVELGYDPTTAGIMGYYSGLIDALVVDVGDEPTLGTYFATQTLMTTRHDRQRLAADILKFIHGII
jgi:LPPG:FO 2-phospho-L-lactate transferase